MIAPAWTGAIPDLAAGVFALAHLVELMAVATIFVASVFVFLLVRLTRERHEFWVVRCPADGLRAVVRLHVADDGSLDDVTACSRLGPGVTPRCDRGCLPKAA